MYTNPMYHPGHHGQPGPYVIYQAEPNWQSMIKQKRDMIMGALHPHVGRTIRVTTIDGHTHEGVLVNVDGHHAYIQVTPHGHHYPGHHRPVYTPAQYNQIMTLVLYELLVILLIS